jgi:hypothetical protein
MVNEYERLDNLGRDIIKLMFPTVPFQVGTITSAYDLKTDRKDKVSLFEVKVRPNTLSTAWDTDILEYDKLSGMRNEDSNAQYFYFMIFKDGVVRLYDLREISIADVFINNKNCPVSGVEDKGYKDKLMIEIKATQAKTYRWKK